MRLKDKDSMSQWMKKIQCLKHQLRKVQAVQAVRLMNSNRSNAHQKISGIYATIMRLLQHYESTNISNQSMIPPVV